jgi:uncharacterized hydrophobic protein (TIGR00271 family)
MDNLKYVKNAYFVYDDDSYELIEIVQNNRFDVEILPINIEDFIDNIVSIGDDISHVVVSISQKKIPEFLNIAYRCNFSIGILPLPSQKEQIKNIFASNDIDKNLDIALRDDYKLIDLLEVNGKLVYSQGLIGFVPLIGKNFKKSKSSFLRAILYAIKKIFTIELQKFDITTENKKIVTTAGTSIIILNHTSNNLISKVFNIKHSMRSSEVTIVIISPFSILEYIKLLSFIFFVKKELKNLPESIGYIKSKSFEIKATKSKRISFDNSESILLPAKIRVLPEALKFNASEEFWKNNEKIISKKETVKISNLPDANEANKYMSKHIQFFRFASEDRFKELFQILRQDAKFNTTFLMLMVLSTILATFGLFSNSAAVIIGAMLVAPLMTPIVSLSMGLLRGEESMIKDSLLKILMGVVLAILSSSILAYILPYSEITSQMRTRIDPTLLDLGVAVLSGIVAAYSKSFKEITQNLAGVAIAVALVPPLAVSGIGLGYGNISIFLGSFLLFFTNLVGIILASVFTFQVLGFSNVVKSKKSIILVVLLLIGVSFPLYISYDKMIQRYNVSKMLKQHRFIVNNKYIKITNATLIFRDDIEVLNIEIGVRGSLSRQDLTELKNDIQRLFNTKLFITAEVKYIL